MQTATVYDLRKERAKLSELRIPFGIFGKDLPEDSEFLKELAKEQLTQVERNEVKRQRALALLGSWWRFAKQAKFTMRGEYFLTIYQRQILRKRPDVSLVTGTMMLAADLFSLVSALDPKARIYIGDLKLMGVDEDKK